MADEIRFVGDLQRVDVRPGDRYVLTVARPISNEMHLRIQAVWKDFMGAGAPILLVLEDGMKLGVFGEQNNALVSQETPAKSTPYPHT